LFKSFQGAFVLSTYIFAFGTTLFLSVLLTWFVRNFAVSRGWTFGPKGDRHLHRIPVPRIGGLAIYGSFLVVVLLSLAIPRRGGMAPPFSVATFLGILGPATIVFLLGLVDDLRSVTPYGKFAVQAVAAVWLYWTGFGIHNLDLIPSGHGLHWPSGLALTVLWVLLVTNAFNLIDGLDGLAAGSALFSILVVLVVSLVTPNPLVTLLAVALAGATLGFLRFNFHPASIFLGDSGSLFIGFMLAALALAGSQKAPTMVAVSIPILSLGLPILDVTLAVARRFLAGKPLFGADRYHIHHKLLRRGLSQQEAVLILYAVSAAFGFLSLILLQGRAMIAFVLAITGVGIFLGVQQLRYQEFTELVSALHRVVRRRQFLANQVAIRHASELLNDSNDFCSICKLLEDALKPIGFDAVLFRKSGPNGFSADCLRPLRYSEDGAWLLSWVENQSPEVAWELKLQLTTGTNGSMEKWGYFSLLRMQNSEPLLLDMNLLTEDFLRALSAAVDRASERLYEEQNTTIQAFAAPKH
jgi:UDP-GlcNAc:undecaprenyl-phosphate/decaprenyl-phosphate GlcNAc-1-phosphate transferase